ncbi:NHL repeat-containing protein [Archangium sp.]|uniref:NHL repeat-containing protein n=1 Tax=Archangium sp. TaxID=1872627 RepID=UPI00286CCF64|nr:NHL repeat-containing protein [Archangium sp.]
MRIARLGVVGLAALAAACGGDEKPAQYRVGGTVTGLSGGGLGLRLNGAESLTRQSDGPFTFEQRLDDKSAYTVTVNTQPAEQDCTVEGGTGKVAGADVTSVQVRCATKTYTVGGTVEGVRGTLVLGLEGGEQLSVTQAGRFTFTTKRPKGGAYTVSVATAPQGQRCTVTSGSGTVAGNVEGISVRCLDWFDLVSTQAATGVIGQVDFDTSTANQNQGAGPGRGTLNGPFGNPALANGRLYVTDQNSNRVLGFTGIPAADGAEAAFVLGQTSFTSTTYGAGQAALDTPAGLSSDGTLVAVADKANSRVLLYTTPPTSTEARPARVIGQPTFEANTAQCDQKSLNFPEGVFVGHGKLLVADTASSRVLVWNTLPTTNEAPADLVLGQVSFTTCAENDADGENGTDANPSASTLWNPTGVWTDGRRLVVADNFNNRVLVWNQFPTRNGQPADVVLGQASFTTNAAATTQSGLSAPTAVTSTGLQFLVADNGNNRVLVWNQYPTTPGAPADLVLGQPDFTTAYTYDPTTVGSNPSARSLQQPSGLLLAWPHLLVSDTKNNRVLVFQSR